MYTSDALLDIHERTHQCLAGLLTHCRGFAPDELNRELAGFGYPTIRLQLVHVLGAENYWMGVIAGRIDVDDHDEQLSTIAALEAWRAEVAGRTAAYLRTATPQELDTPRRMSVWNPQAPVERVLAPARIVVRTQTHIFQHQGQVAAQCRLLGRPVPGFDFPLT